MNDMRYAQEKAGQKLHLVQELDLDLTGREVAFRALCGRSPSKRGEWRMTINISLGEVCRSCIRAYHARLAKHFDEKHGGG